MLLTSIRVEGLRAAPEVALEDLGAVATLPAGAEGGAVADGLLLLGAALRPSGARAALHRLDVAGPDTGWLLEDGLLDEVEALDADGVDALLQSGASRHVTVAVEVRPDPPMYRRLRDEAARDPRLLAALASGAGVSLRVGWLFNRAGTHASVSVLALRVGEERFPTGKIDRAPWMIGLLGAVGERLARADAEVDEATLAARLHEAALSPDPRRRAAWERGRTMLAGPPFALGAVHLVRTGGGRLRLAVGDALVPLRVHGPRALDAVRLVHAALVERPDVLVVDRADATTAAWLATLTEGDDAALEQLLVRGGPEVG